MDFAILRYLSTVVLLMALSACGGGSAPSASGPSDPLAASTSSGQASPLALSAATTVLTGGAAKVGSSALSAAADSSAAFTAPDALSALKLASGRNPNSDPDGPGTQTPASISAAQINAVDLNVDGRVSLTEALQVLTMAANGTPATAPTAPTISSATAGDRTISLAFVAPSYSGGRAVSGDTASCTSGSLTASASGVSSPLAVSGLNNDVAYACTVSASNAIGSSPQSDALSATPSSPSATSFAPEKFASAIHVAYTAGTLAAATGFVTRKRYLVGDTGSTPLLWETGTKGSNAYPLSGAAIDSGSTRKTFLSKTLQAVADSTDASCFRLDAHLQSNYSIDVDTSAANRLIFRNNWSTSGTSGHGYLCFTYDSTTRLLKASKRYSYSSSTYTHTLDSPFALQGYYVRYVSGVASLVASSAQATQLALYASPINFDMPTDFNPNALTGSTNSAMPYQTSYQKISSTTLASIVTRPESAAFKSQISVDGSTPTIGYHATTAAQQDLMLATIESTAQTNGFTLRYPLGTYKTFRDAALRNVIFGDSIVDGSVGEYSVPMIYFVNPKDRSGAYHPAMIVVAYSVPEGPHTLRDVVRPPGGGDTSITICNQGVGGTGYANQCVTRSTLRQNFLFRIPMRDYGLTTSLCDNTMGATLFSDYKKMAASTCNSSTTIENYASIADNGVMIDGTSIYPVLNNILITSQEESSLNLHGCHVGQGFGYHCHADGFSALGNGLSLYNERDYASRTHPPLIGFGFDGIALYGRYLPAYPAMVGYTASNTAASSSTPVAGNDLDAYGGHTHLIDGASRYHQHARPYAAKTLPMGGGISGGLSYTVHSLITGAWRGRINDIPDFWDGTKPNTRGVFPSLTN